MYRTMHHLLLNITCEECGLYGSSTCVECDVERSRQQLVTRMMQQPGEGSLNGASYTANTRETLEEVSLLSLNMQYQHTA